MMKTFLVQMVLVCLILVLSPVSAGFGGNGQGGGGHGQGGQGQGGKNDKDEQNEADGSGLGCQQSHQPLEKKGQWIDLWGPDFKIEFNITISSFPKQSTTVFQFTWSTYDSGKWTGKARNCIPCLRLEKNSTQMKFVSKLNNNKNFTTTFEFELNQTYHVIIEQSKLYNYSNEYFYQIEINGKKEVTVENNMAKQIKGVTFYDYEISPWSDSSFTNIGLLKNFTFVEGTYCNELNDKVNESDCSAIGKKMCSEVTDGCYETYCYDIDKICPEYWEELSDEYFDDFESNCEDTSEDGLGGIVLGEKKICIPRQHKYKIKLAPKGNANENKINVELNNVQITEIDNKLSQITLSMHVEVMWTDHRFNLSGENVEIFLSEDEHRLIWTPKLHIASDLVSHFKLEEDEIILKMNLTTYLKKLTYISITFRCKDMEKNFQDFPFDKHECKIFVRYFSKIIK